VARVAAVFGGGGHPTAAGCSVAGSMKLTQEKVLKAVAEELARADATAAQSTTGQTLPEG
jgi:nanoRNase/pAp phosphatase (c-di-AMP/oligoRNAs hydrolase)